MHAGEKNLVRLHGISKSYGSQVVLRDFSLEIESGERFVLLGQSGSGKTTLLRLIAGFESPDAGSIFIDGQEVNALPVEQRPVGFIFQRHALFPHMTVFDNIAVGPRIRGMAEPEIARHIDELLEIARLTPLKHAWPSRLSGGESQRVALARAVINRPKVLLLDEPLSALDENLRQSLRDELAEMQRTFGITFLFVTHDQNEAMSLADRMAILEEGRPLQVGSPEELYHHPQNEFVAQFLGDVNRVEGMVDSVDLPEITITIHDVGRLNAQCHEPISVGQPVTVFFRPEKVILIPGDNGSEPSDPLKGTIHGRQFLGSRTRYQVRLTNGKIISAITSFSQTSLNDGDSVIVHVFPGEIMIFNSATEAHRRD